MTFIRCSNCGNVFETNKGRQKYCCNECREEAALRRLELKSKEERIYTKCIVCGKPLDMKVYHSYKYCSKACMRKKNGHKKVKSRKEIDENSKTLCRVASTCYYANTSNKSFIFCDYLDKTGQVRGGLPSECTHWKPRKKKK